MTQSIAKTGLVLEGGGMRGVFTAGVLDYFLEQDIQFDTCIGVSAGSCLACSYFPSSTEGDTGRSPDIWMTPDTAE